MENHFNARAFGTIPRPSQSPLEGKLNDSPMSTCFVRCFPSLHCHPELVSCSCREIVKWYSSCMSFPSVFLESLNFFSLHILVFFQFRTFYIY
jgi:hypothetical protein